MFSVCEERGKKKKTHTPACAQTHTLLQHCPPVISCKSEEREKRRRMSVDMRCFPGLCDSAAEATFWGGVCWGRGWSILWQWSGKVQGFVCLFVKGGDFWSLFMLPHYQLLTLARDARSMQHGAGLAVPAPSQPLRTPAATWNTHWQCLLIRR